jgi:hypothetical protein
MKLVQKKFIDVEWQYGYINTGVFLVSKVHRNIFQPYKGEYWTGWGSDDVHLGFMINLYRHRICELTYKFNHMTMFSETWNGSPDHLKSFIIHYAGKGIFNKGIKSRLKQIQHDLSVLYR